jgi:putative DNA primase/helicase
VDETDILNAIEKQATINTINSKEKNELLEALKQVSRKKQPAPIKPTWIQFKNKIIDIETGNILRASPDFFVTNPIPWELHPENFIETPNMDRIFEEWVGKENVQKLYEILAYCLIPAYPINRLFCFIGGGLNGKSKFLDLLRKFVGNSNCCSTELDTLLNSRFEVTRLHKKLVCMMGETNFEEMSKTSLLKKLTGGDLIGFEYKNKDPFEEKNYAKILIATNNLPSTTDKTIGFYRRWMIVDFPNQFSEKKDILGEIPDEEYKCLALKCSFLLKDLLENRSFTNEGSVEERMEKYEEKSNFLDKFIKEFVDQKFGGHITKADFYKKFSDWSKSNRHRSISQIVLSKEMTKRGYEGGIVNFNWMNDGKGGTARVWKDISWR